MISLLISPVTRLRGGTDELKEAQCQGRVGGSKHPRKDFPYNFYSCTKNSTIYKLDFKYTLCICMHKKLAASKMSWNLIRR